MKRAIAVVALILNLLVGHALAAYDPEYGDETGNLPAMTVLNPLDGSLIITSEFSLIGREHPVFGSVRPHKGTDLGYKISFISFASQKLQRRDAIRALFDTFSQCERSNIVLKKKFSIRAVI